MKIEPRCPCHESPCSCTGVLRRALRVAGLEAEPTTCTMRDFAAVNVDLSDASLDAVIALHAGDSLTFGGGAAPLVTVTRLS